jgi:hypothetical protein
MIEDAVEIGLLGHRPRQLRPDLFVLETDRKVDGRGLDAACRLVALGAVALAAMLAENRARSCVSVCQHQYKVELKGLLRWDAFA